MSSCVILVNCLDHLDVFPASGSEAWAVPPFPSASEVPRAALRADWLSYTTPLLKGENGEIEQQATRIQNITGHVLGNPKFHCSPVLCDYLRLAGS